MTKKIASAEESSQYSQLEKIPTKANIGDGLARPIPAPEKELDPEARRKVEEARAEQRSIREQAIKRYQVACMAYIGAMLRKSDAVTTVWERVVDKWLAGKLSGYSPVGGGGKPQLFRVYLKTVLRHEVFAYGREQKREAEHGPVRLDSGYDHADTLEATASEAFDSGVQDTVIERALEAIRREDTLYYETLKLLTGALASERKTPKSKEIAAFLSTIDGKKISEENARQIKKRAKEAFARKIIEEVGLFIGNSDLEKIEAALRDWNLIAYCEKELGKMRGDGQRD